MTPPDRPDELRHAADDRLRIAEQSVKDEPDQARAVFAALAEGVLVVASNGQIVDANPSAGRILGIARELLLEQNVFDEPWPMRDEQGNRVAPEDGPIVAALRSKSPEGRLVVTSTPDGTEVILVVIGMPLPRSKGQPWVVATLLDVTRERRAELALAASERRFRSLIDHAPDPVLVVAQDGGIRLCNPRAADIFGYSADELMGLNIEALLPPSERAGHVARREEYHRDATTRQMGGGLSLRARRKDGSEFPIEVGLSPIDTPDGPCVIAIARDLTDRVIAEAAIRADHATNDFLSRMSHELRTPLNSVLGFAQLLAMGDLSDDQSDSVNQILAAGRHLLELLNDLLDFERARSGHLSFTITDVDVDDTIAKALSLVQPLADSSAVQIDAARRDRPAIFVRSDRQRLMQVLLNLLSNAIKYNRPNGRVLVNAREVDGKVTIDVVDGGRGIDPQHLQRLFQPFDRLDADREGVPGTGVGLAMSRMLIEGMGGTITVTSEVGQGSTFSLHLPTGSRAVLQERSESSPIRRPAMPRADVLYVEDNDVNVHFVARALADTDVNLSIARSGVGAIETARRTRPDLVLLDLNLPDLPGETLVRVLRSDARTRDIPIIVITADANPDRLRNMLERGVYACITKPIELGVLFDHINAVLAAPDQTVEVRT
jgi:PAS domain S-box-containing protein